MKLFFIRYNILAEAPSLLYRVSADGREPTAVAGTAAGSRIIKIALSAHLIVASFDIGRNSDSHLIVVAGV